MSRKKDTTKIHAISVEKLREEWPTSADGKLCAALLQRYMYSLLVDTANDADCNAVTAQAEAAAHKTMAQMAKDFATLGTEPHKPEEGLKLPTLNRFGGGSKREDEKKKTP